MLGILWGWRLWEAANEEFLGRPVYLWDINP
jgi:hypothetical protein